MISLYYGPDSYSTRAALSATLSRLGIDLASVSARFEGADSRWTDIDSTCRTLPLFESVNVVVVRGFLASLTTRSKKGADGDAINDQRGPADRRCPPVGQWSADLRSLPTTTHLFFWESDDIPTTNVHVKALREMGDNMTLLVRTVAPEGPALRAWQNTYVAEKGCSLDGQAASMLAAQSPGDLWAQASNLDKLCAAVGPGGCVTVQHVQQLIALGHDTTVFALADAALGGRAAQAIALCHQLTLQGAAPEHLMAVLAGRLRDNYTGQGNRFGGSLALSPAQQASAYSTLVQADRLLKTGSTDERNAALDLLVLALALREPLLGQATT